MGKKGMLDEKIKIKGSSIVYFPLTRESIMEKGFWEKWSEKNGLASSFLLFFLAPSLSPIQFPPQSPIYPPTSILDSSTMAYKSVVYDVQNSQVTAIPSGLFQENNFDRPSPPLRFIANCLKRGYFFTPIY